MVNDREGAATPRLLLERRKYAFDALRGPHFRPSRLEPPDVAAARRTVEEYDRALDAQEEGLRSTQKQRLRAAIRAVQFAEDADAVLAALAEYESWAVMAGLMPEGHVL